MRCVDLMTSESRFLLLGGGTVTASIFIDFFSKFRSEVLKSGITFEVDPLIFTVSGMTSSGRHF